MDANVTTRGSTAQSTFSSQRPSLAYVIFGLIVFAAAEGVLLRCHQIVTSYRANPGKAQKEQGPANSAMYSDDVLAAIKSALPLHLLWIDLCFCIAVSSLACRFASVAFIPNRCAGRSRLWT